MISKTERVLSIYDRLLAGKVLVKREEADRFEVDERTIQRDFDDIRAHFSDEEYSGRELVYSRRRKGYIVRRVEEKSK